MFNLPLLDKMLSAFFNGKKKFLLNDKLNCMITPVILIIFVIIVSTKQNIGKPLNCITPTEFRSGWEEFVENYCFLNGVYPAAANESLPLRSKNCSNFYVWVPIILSLQSLLFYVPYVVWCYITRLSIINCKIFQGSKNIEFYKIAVFTLKGSSFIDKNYYSLMYMLLKIMFIINIFLQYYIYCKLLNANYFLWGVDVLSNNYVENFNYINYCDFYFRTLGNSIQEYTIQCFLSINYFNKIIFIFLWFWLIILFCVNLFSVLHFIITFLHVYRMQHFKRYLKCQHLDRFVNKFISSDIYLLFQFIENDSNIIDTNNFCAQLYKIYIESEFNKDVVA